MRNKVAKELRRIAKFNPHDKREYKTWTLPRKRYVMQVDKDMNVSYVVKTVDCHVTECVSGPRKVYKHLKQFYKGFTNEQEYNVLPDNDEIKRLEKDYIEGFKSLPKEENDNE